MNRVRTIIVSVVICLLLGGFIIAWSVYKRGGLEKTTTLVRVFNDENFESDVVKASVQHPILVDFYAPWCMPCRLLEPTIEEIAKDLEGKAIVGKLDTDKNMIAQRLGIKRIPAVWIIRNGEIKDAFYGVVPKETIVKALEESGS